MNELSRHVSVTAGPATQARGDYVGEFLATRDSTLLQSSGKRGTRDSDGTYLEPHTLGDNVVFVGYAAPGCAYPRTPTRDQHRIF